MGDPITSGADFRTIAACSPRDDVGAGPDPPMLAVAGLTDPRVTCWEPAKGARRLRERSTSGNPVFLEVNMEAGHAGASNRFAYHAEVAHAYAFALRAAGWT